MPSTVTISAMPLLPFLTVITYLCFVGLTTGSWLGLTTVLVPMLLFLPGFLFVPVVEALVPATVPSDEDSDSEPSEVSSAPTSTTASLLPPVVVPLSSLSVFLQAAKAKMVAKTRSSAKILFIFFPPKKVLSGFLNTAHFSFTRRFFGYYIKEGVHSQDLR